MSSDLHMHMHPHLYAHLYTHSHKLGNNKLQTAKTQPSPTLDLWSIFNKNPQCITATHFPCFSVDGKEAAFMNIYYVPVLL